MKRHDAIIVGQGLAGSLLAWHLIQRGQDILVVDTPMEGASSKVASGLINPIRGKRLTLQQAFSENMQVALDTYRAIEKTLKIEIFQAVPQYRKIRDQTQKSQLNKLAAEEMTHAYLGSHLPSIPGFALGPLGGVEIRQSYIVSTAPLLHACRLWLKQHNALSEEALSYRDLKIQPEEVTWKATVSDRIIFCEGHRVSQNPWLKKLPFQPAMGSVFTVDCPKLEKAIYNWGKWLAPTDQEGLYKLGATYLWLNTSTPRNAKKEADRLLADFKLHIESSPLKILHEQSGIRPCTLNQEVIVGAHPKHPNLICFNGFGSTGCLTIPRQAQRLSERLVEKATLPLIEHI